MICSCAAGVREPWGRGWKDQGKARTGGAGGGVPFSPFAARGESHLVVPPLPTQEVVTAPGRGLAQREANTRTPFEAPSAAG